VTRKKKKGGGERRGGVPSRIAFSLFFLLRGHSRSLKRGGKRGKEKGGGDEPCVPQKIFPSFEFSAQQKIKEREKKEET